MPGFFYPDNMLNQEACLIGESGYIKARTSYFTNVFFHFLNRSGELSGIFINFSVF